MVRRYHNPKERKQLRIVDKMEIKGVYKRSLFLTDSKDLYEIEIRTNKRTRAEYFWSDGKRYDLEQWGSLYLIANYGFG